MKKTDEGIVTLYLHRETAEQKKRQLQCIQDLDETCENLKRKTQDSTEVGQRINAVLNKELTDYKLLMNDKVLDVISEDQITAKLTEAKKTCDKCAVVIGEVDERLKEMKELIKTCRGTSGSI